MELLKFADQIEFASFSVTFLREAS